MGLGGGEFNQNGQPIPMARNSYAATPVLTYIDFELVFSEISSKFISNEQRMVSNPNNGHLHPFCETSRTKIHEKSSTIQRQIYYVCLQLVSSFCQPLHFASGKFFVIIILIPYLG